MYAFVHIEKTGGSTLNTILRRAFGTRHCDIRLPLARRRFDRDDKRVFIEAADVHRVRRLYRNLSGIAGHNVKAYADLSRQFPEIRFATILRDPTARFLSHFINRAPGHDRQAFDNWLARGWSQNWQTKMIAGEPNGEKAIELIAIRFGFVGLTERFDESLLLLAEWLDEPNLQASYRSANRTSDKRRPRDLSRQQSDISYLDSAEVRELIREANAEDQKVYDYVTAKTYPRQLASYRGNLAADLQAFERRNREPNQLIEPLWGRVMRNFVYKPLIHCHVM
jgi:hypothetical protein